MSTLVRFLISTTLKLTVAALYLSVLALFLCTMLYFYLSKNRKSARMLSTTSKNLSKLSSKTLAILRS